MQASRGLSLDAAVSRSEVPIQPTLVHFGTLSPTN